MFTNFRNKAELQQENEQLLTLIRASEKFIDRYIQLLESMTSLVHKTKSRSLYMLPSTGGKKEETDYYFIDFCIITEQTAFGLYEIEYNTYKLTTTRKNTAELVCSLNAEVQACRDGQKRIDIVTLDSMEQRRGHATKLLSKLKEYALQQGIVRIRGDLHSNTPVGIENLRAFYSQNGFTVTEHTFYLDVSQN